MPSRMIINVDSTAGYNNELKQAVAGMKLGMNNSVNQETKRVGVKLIGGGGSKVKDRLDILLIRSDPLAGCCYAYLFIRAFSTNSKIIPLKSIFRTIFYPIRLHQFLLYCIEQGPKGLS